MSRGNGRLQSEILDRVRAEKGGCTTLESIRWDLARKPGDLPKSWTYALERAVDGMVKRRKLVVHIRPLATLDEWLVHYPAKTHRREIHQLRLDLLPVLVEWVQSDEGPRPLYPAYENERFYARGEGGSINMRRGADLGVAYAPEWKMLEPKLLRLFEHTNSEALFFLIASGKYLFTKAPILPRISIRDMIDRCDKEGVIPTPLLAEVRSLAERFMPPEKAGALGLKSMLYRFITSVSRGHPELKPEALEALYKKRPTYLTAISGYTPPVVRKGLWIGRPAPGGTIAPRSPLERLIDQTTFKKFKFLSLPVSEGSSTLPIPT